jgi:hypothetical protein
MAQDSFESTDKTHLNTSAITSQTARISLAYPIFGRMDSLNDPVEVCERFIFQTWTITFTELKDKFRRKSLGLYHKKWYDTVTCSTAAMQ